MKMLLFLMVLLLVAYMGGTAWFYTASKKAIATKHEAQVAQERMTKLAKDVETAKAELVATADKRRLLTEYLPPEENINTFFSYVNGLATKYGVTANFVFAQGQSASAVSNAGELPLTINVASDKGMASVLAFITDLEQGTYRITMRNVGLSSLNAITASPAVAVPTASQAVAGNDRAVVEFTLYVNKAAN